MTQDEIIRKALHCAPHGAGPGESKVAEIAAEEIARLEALLRRREHEVERKDKRVHDLELALAESPVPPGKYAYVADKRRRKVEQKLSKVEAAARAVIDGYRCAIDASEYPEEAQESYVLADRLERALGKENPDGK